MTNPLNSLVRSVMSPYRPSLLKAASKNFGRAPASLDRSPLLVRFYNVIIKRHIIISVKLHQSAVRQRPFRYHPTSASPLRIFIGADSEVAVMVEVRICSLFAVKDESWKRK
jgi:hypothetical protein